MVNTPTQSLRIFSAAKVNLFLHVLGELPAGYHDLDSLISFVDIGDTIHIEPSSNLEFQIDGPYADSFSAEEMEPHPHSHNLIIQAFYLMRTFFPDRPYIKITLTKNLPLAAGLGGGSANAAALLWGLAKIWDIPDFYRTYQKHMLELGADIPVCFYSQSATIQGVGNIDQTEINIPELPTLLINPNQKCSTADVFKRHTATPKAKLHTPKDFVDTHHFIDFLTQTSNDLTGAACENIPAIGNILSALKTQNGCLLSRMSGSGASCFGLFPDDATRDQAAETIQRENPDWWVAAGIIGRSGRY